MNLKEGEYTRDDDCDGKHEINVNTMEGFGSLLRPRLKGEEKAPPTQESVPVSTRGLKQ